MNPPLPIRLDIGDPPDGEAVNRTLPARPGVAVFENATSETVLVAAGRDLRALVRRRLALDETGHTRARTNLAGVTARVLACGAGSMLEADLQYLETARSRAPEIYKVAAERWRAWYLHVDTAAPLPTWRKTDLTELADAGTPPGTLIGPFPDKDAAKRFGELLDDLFDLCRYPSILARSPDAEACAYKEMGRCPAPCDGSEPFESYRARALEAVAFGAGDRRAAVARWSGEMDEAAAALDFERASRLKRRVDLGAKATRRAFARATSIDRFGLLAVTPSERRGWARLIVIDGRRAGAIADVHADAPRDELAGILARIPDPRPGGPSLDAPTIDRLGLAARRLFSGGPKAETLFPLADDHVSPEALARAVRRAARTDPSGEGADPGAGRELEPGA